MTPNFRVSSTRCSTMESLIALPDHFDSVDIALFDQLGSSISAKETDMLACGIGIS